MTIEGQLADFVLAEYNANPAAVQAAIEQGEGGFTSLITNVLKNIPPGKGIAAIVLPYIEGGIEGFAAKLVAAYTPAQLYALIGSWLAAEAKTLGG